MNKWRVAGIKRAVASLDRGESVSHNDVKDWVGSWSRRRERPLPNVGRHEHCLIAEAIEDLISLKACIAEDGPTAARQVVFRIVHDIEQLLPDNPHIGRPGRVPGTRELVIQ